MKIHLIPEWRNSWKFASIRWSAFGAVLMIAIEFFNASYNMMPPFLQTRIPHTNIIAVVLFAFTMIGRLLAPKPKKDCDDDQEQHNNGR